MAASGTELDLLSSGNKSSADAGNTDEQESTILSHAMLHGKACPSRETLTSETFKSKGKPQVSNTMKPKSNKTVRNKEMFSTNPGHLEDIQDESSMDPIKNDSVENVDNLNGTHLQHTELRKADTEESTAPEAEKITLNSVTRCSKEDSTVPNQTLEVTCASQEPQLPNFLQVEIARSSSSSVPSNSNHKSSLTPLPTTGGVKQEQPDSQVKAEPQDDIKEYAETTMNELLGWYGLSKLDKADTTRLALSGSYPGLCTEDTSAIPEGGASVKSTTAEHLRTAIPASSVTVETALVADSEASSSENEQSSCASRALAQAKVPTDTPTSTVHKPVSTRALTQAKVPTDTPTSTVHKPVSTSCGVAVSSMRPSLDTVTVNYMLPARSDNTCPSVDKTVPVVTPEPLNDSNNNSDHFVGNDDSDDDDFVEDGDQEDDDISDEIRNLASPDIGPSDLGSAIVCSWCQKDGTKLFTLATPAGIKAFCSEVCFTQCRRASFKKNKVCDWCKRVRHTVNFVDLQEGDMQLQFCTEKCLNQYKMNIFCTEARQHMEQIEKMTGDGNSKFTKAKESKGEILITPELWLSCSSSAVCEIKKEKPDMCGDDSYGDGVDKDGPGKDMRNNDEGKEPGEVREKDIHSDPLRMNVVGASVDRDRKALLQDHTFTGEREVIGKNDKQQSGAFEHRLPSYTSGYSSHESPGMLASLNVSSAVSDTTIDSRSQNQRRSRERIRKLLVGEPVNRSSSPQAGRRDIDMTSHRYPPVDTGTKRVAPNASTESMVSEQQLLGHPIFQHWATSQLLAMLPSMPPPLPASLSSPSAAAHLASLGYVAGTPQMLYPGLFGATSLRLPAATGSTSAQSHFGTAQPRSADALRSESTPVSLPSRHPVGDGSNSRRSANPSPLSPSSSNSSIGTPIPPTAQPTLPLAPGIAQAMACSNSVASSNDIRALQSYLFNRSSLPPGLPSIPAHAQHLSHLPGLSAAQHLSHIPGLSASTAGAQPELSHPISRNHNDGSASRLPPTPSQSQSTPPQTVPPLFPQPPGVPPVTVLVPYPVAVPIPIPLPIPLPISPEKLFAFFEEKSKTSNECNSTEERSNFHKSFPNPTRHRSQSSSSSGSKMSGSSPIGLSSSAQRYTAWASTTSDGRALSSSSTTSSRGDQCPVISNERGEASDSISMLRREIGKSGLPDFASSNFTNTASQSLKRPRHASPHQLHLQTLSINLSKRTRTNSPPCSHNEENEAMDLTKPSSRTDSPPSDQNIAQPGASTDNRPMSGEGAVALRDSPLVQNTLLPPRIHIVLNEEPPLNAEVELNGSNAGFTTALPPVPDQSTYSSRRSRILDAPSIPRKSPRSPSPERRYVRTVPRDMVEAARRRGLRTRVRSK